MSIPELLIVSFVPSSITSLFFVFLGIGCNKYEYSRILCLCHVKRDPDGFPHRFLNRYNIRDQTPTYEHSISSYQIALFCSPFSNPAEMNLAPGSKLNVSIVSLRTSSGISFVGLPFIQTPEIYFYAESIGRGFASTTSFSTTDSGKATDSVLSECATLGSSTSSPPYFQINLTGNSSVSLVIPVYFRSFSFKIF